MENWRFKRLNLSIKYGKVGKLHIIKTTKESEKLLGSSILVSDEDYNKCKELFWESIKNQNKQHKLSFILFGVGFYFSYSDNNSVINLPFTKLNLTFVNYWKK